ncbi:Glycosyltransferase, GT2 family [Austwickia chelonae]|uniref:Glycosyltransferase 2-like domain-containing protein n=1 Tax=Austwickia chelonae NBRC 105200 TaxID=1184607 RepID=K6W4T4_9MICO|nr:glycosyltransferase family 2 protein [Austwickia chelonae]GAB76827.1 hypothetical protein AUCHE_03_00440 [Austwickia chelonae NBRC 105200]SEW31223.1 Glycosyltransferase, GT2 family [Austwickia chelonae]
MAVPQFEIVLVSYRSAPLVERLVHAWGEAISVIVVDNARDVDGLSSLPESCPWVTYVDGQGQGFARAANKGALRSKTPYVIFVNPDCTPTVDDLSNLVEGLSQDHTALSHAATMTSHDGEIEIGVGGWEPSVRRALVFGFGLHKALPSSGLYAKPSHSQHIEVDWTTGACMAVRRQDFLRVGGFDESFYVYCEDLSLGRRARNVGLRQVLRADVKVKHGAGNSGAPSEEMLRMRGASIANYVKRYHPLEAPAIRVALAAGNGMRAVQRQFQGDKDEARGFCSYVAGVVTRSAHVGGQEVARARMQETEQPPGRRGDR